MYLRGTRQYVNRVNAKTVEISVVPPTGGISTIRLPKTMIGEVLPSSDTETEKPTAEAQAWFDYVLRGPYMRPSCRE